VRVPSLHERWCAIVVSGLLEPRTGRVIARRRDRTEEGNEQMNKQRQRAFRLRRAPFQRVRRGAGLLLVSGLALSLSACSSPGPASAPSASTAVSSAPVASSGAGGESNVTVWTLSSATKPGIGAYLVAESTTGEDALTVYVFDKDVPGSGSSACDVSCAKTWPPLLLTEGATVRATGVTGKVAQVTRSDGTVQVTYNGAPLYFYVGDHGAGDTNGQGVSASWRPATP
jgi:predicted lipoprotein with Yx(FWY)xxD motif